MNDLGNMIFIVSLLLTLNEVNRIDATTPEAQDIITYVFMLIRHGDRAPTTSYPTDPHKNYTWTEGMGQLTNAGKQRIYELGQNTTRYKELTGCKYNVSKVLMQSSDADRCLMSAQLFLAGCFPPFEEQVWNEQLMWQPSSVHTAPPKCDNVIAMSAPCSRRDQAEKQFYETSSLVKEICANYSDLFLYLQNHTGLNSSECTKETFWNLIVVQDALLIQSQHNLTLPAWTRKNDGENYRDVYPEPMTFVRSLVMAVETEDPTVAKLAAGPMLCVMAAGMMDTAKKNHTIPQFIYTQKNMPPAPMHVISGHDITIITVLRALNMYNNTSPPYGATLAFELHSTNESHHVTAVYGSSIHDPPQELEIPGCPGNCSLADFIDRIRPLMPQNWDSECYINKTTGTNSAN